MHFFVSEMAINNVTTSTEYIIEKNTTTRDKKKYCIPAFDFFFIYNPY